MAYPSLFWALNYKKLRMCCTFDPLKVQTHMTGNGMLIDFIDTDWMTQKKMKWIGIDKHGYKAWVTPDGTIYRFKDLERNEEGKQVEKENREKFAIPNDGEATKGMAKDILEGDNLYKWELKMQETCAFCMQPGSGGESEAAPPNSNSGNDDDKSSDTGTIPNWQGYTQGGGTDYGGMYGNPTSAYGTGATDSIPENAGVTYKGGVIPQYAQGGDVGYWESFNARGSEEGAANGGGRNKTNIDPVPLMPLKTLENSDTDNGGREIKPINPVISTLKVAHKKITEKVPVLETPFKTHKYRYIVQPEDEFLSPLPEATSPNMLPPIPSYRKMMGDIKDDDISAAIALLNDSLSYTQTLKKFAESNNGIRGAYSAANLNYGRIDNDAMNSRANNSNPAVTITGKTEIKVKLNDGSIKDIATLTPEQIANATSISVTILINNSDTHLQAIEALNHELTIHAVRFAEIIAQPGVAVPQKVMQLRALAGTQNAQHSDIANPGSLYNRVNDEILSQFSTKRDAQTETELLGHFHDVDSSIPNNSTYNNYLWTLYSVGYAVQREGIQINLDQLVHDRFIRVYH